MSNPANKIDKSLIPEGYQPMGMGVKRLDVPHKDGYHRRWFRGDPNRIHRAQRAGYRFVDPEDVDVNNFDLAGDVSVSGNTDMGSRVSVIAGNGIMHDGQPGRMYLMEVPIELYEHGRKFIEDVNEGVVEALKGGKLGSENESPVDRGNRYRKGNMPELFTPNKNRRQHA